MYRIPNSPLRLGHRGDAADVTGLFAAGVEAVVDLAREEPPLELPRDLIHIRVPILDGADNPEKLLRLAVEAIVRLIETDTSTLICCSYGQSRTPAFAAAALAVSRRAAVESCLAEIAAGHHSDVDPGLWQDLAAVAHTMGRPDH